MSCDIHPTAVIEDGAKIGADTRVGPYSVIGANVILGEGCQVDSHVVIRGHTTIGAGSHIYPFASLGGDPQDLKFRGEPSTLVVGKNNSIREYVTLHPGTKTGHMTTIIGDNNLFMVNSHVAHDCVIGSNNVFANSVAIAGHVTLGNYVTLGGLAAVHQFTRVGDRAFVGGGAMITGDFPPFCIGQGDRCKIHGLNIVGLRRAGLTKDDINALRKAYRAIFSSIGGYARKIENLPSEVSANSYVQTFTEFIKAPHRVLAKPVRPDRSELEE